MSWFAFATVENGYFNINAAESQIAEFNWDTALSPEWRKRHVRHFFELPNPAHEQTHIMLVEGPHETPYCMRFGTQRIYGPFLIFAYNAEKKETKFLHCQGCAVQIVNWLIKAQPTWREEGGGYVSQGVSLYQ